MEQTKVVCTCVSKKETKQYGQTNNPLNTEIGLQPPYDTSNIYYQLSGGTVFTLNTINQTAADMFEVGKNYEVLISPTEEK